LLEGAVVTISKRQKKDMCDLLHKPNSDLGNLAIWPIFGAGI
jgi:hypothetical protein